jgi:D-alanyl-D-alanine carboxypeptidase
MGRRSSAKGRVGVRATILTVVLLGATGVAGLTGTASALSRHQRIVQRLDGVVKALTALETPGYVLGVTGGDVGRFERSVGVRDLSTKKPMTLNTHFRIGSITKTFTATVILKLVERGRLHLNDPISKWEPGVPNARRITIKMLLNMTSGIWDEGGVGPNGEPSTLSAFMIEWCDFRPTPKFCHHYFSPQKIVDLAIKDSKNITHGPAYPPGVWYYSDTNFVMLGIIAQRVTGKPFGSLLKHYVFDPLHLKDTSFPTRTLSLPSPSASGNWLTENATHQIAYVPQLQPSPSSFFSAGAVVSTLHDLQIWARALGTGALLTPSMQRLRLQLVKAGLSFAPLAGTSPTIGLAGGYGLGIADIGGMLGHNGEVPGYTAEMWYLPSVKGTVVALFNNTTPCVQTPKVADILADTAWISLAQNAFGSSLQRFGLEAPYTCPVPGAAGPAASGRPPLH